MIIDRELEEKLIKENIGLVIAQAIKYKSNRISDTDDYIQAGRIALLRAIRSYNPAKGSLATYAWKCIQREIMKEVVKFGNIPEVHGLNETIAVPESGRQLWEALTCDLTDNEKKALELKLEGRSHSSIGEIMGFSKQWSSRLVLSAIMKIREANA